MDKLKEIFKTLVDSLERAGKDLATIDVVTTTGSIVNLLNDDGSNKISVKNVSEIIKNFSTQTNGANTEGELKLVCLTHIDFDHDTVQFVREGESLSSDLVKLHQQSVETAVTARNEMLRFIGNFL